MGWSGSGKTTFLEKIVEIMSHKGIRVGVIKHHGHSGVLMDSDKKDSSRYCNAGAKVVTVSSPDEYIEFRRPTKEATLEELIDKIEDECDIIIAEGFKTCPINAIELCRKSHNTTPIIDDSKLFALVTDYEERAKISRKNGIEVFGLDEHQKMVDFLINQAGLGA